MRRSSRINFFLLLVAVVSLSVICDISVYAATVQYYIQADQTTLLGYDGTANLPAGNTTNGIYSTTFTTSAPTGSNTQIRNTVSGTNWAHLGYVYRGADYGGNVQITGTPSGTMYVRSASNSDQFRFVLIDYNPVSGTKTVLATSTVVNGNTSITSRSITFPAGTYVIPVDHRLLVEIQFKPNSNGNYGRIYCNSSSYPSSITVDETVTGVNHTITASSGGNGTITPSGAVTVPHHNDQSFSMTPDSGYGLSDVTVDGVSMGPVNPYNFVNVTADHTITASFLPTYTITTSPGANGSITPAGPYDVLQGASQTFTITANSGYAIQQVYVDGDPQGPINSYTFTGVTNAHTISATFAPLYTITATAGTNGTITPGTVTIVEGDSQVFFFSPNSGFTVDTVTVDGVSMGAMSSYKFSNITSNHTISVTFMSGPTMNSYCIKPPFLATSIPPNVMIMLSVETPMQGAAHQDLTCTGSPTT
ncbi:MAG TPA: hypothetical protein PK036_07820, partial [Geobacteraceae bacterium]|nr:hypothetical protein [Geobacteraceae bacterium]